MKKSGSLIIVFFLLLYILPLGVRPMVIPDEFRYAEISREMVETRNWVVPHLNGLRYFEKPILGHWLHALSIKLMGANSFAIRLPSALAVGLSALMLFFLVRRFTSDTVAAMMAASIFLTCLEVYAVGMFCVLDSIFSLFIAASMIAFFFAFMEIRPLKRTFYLVGSGVGCGLAFLTKGFLAFVIPVIVIVPFAIWQRQFKELLSMVWVWAIAAVLIALPWSIMIHLRESDFWHYFFWVEHVDRFISADNGQHPNSFWFYAPFILGGALPWTARIGAAIFRIGKTPHKEPLLCFAICWFLFPFLFFSACRGKLGTYILPCFPPLIVLFTIGLRQEFMAKMAKRYNRSDITGLALVMTAIVALVLTQTVIPQTKIYGLSETWKWLLLTIGLLSYEILLIQAGRATTHTRKFCFSCSAPLLIMFSAHFAIPYQLMEKKAPAEFLMKHKDRISQETTIVSDDHLTPAACWYYKRSDVFLLDRAGELAYGLKCEDSSQRLLDIDQLNGLVAESSAKGCIALVTSAKRYALYRQLLPTPVFEDIDHGFVFAQFAASTALSADIR